MTDLAVAQRAPQFDLSPQTFDQALTFAGYLADSDMVPKDFKGKPGNCLIAMQWGAELGLKPLQALQNLAIINGRPSLWGDAVIALVRGSPLCEYVVEEDDGKVATCKVKRRGEPEQARTFSMVDATAAGLSGKQGPWTQYPKRMRQMRARAFALRDVFPDVLRGLPVAEELMDTPPPTERFMGAAEVLKSEGGTATEKKLPGQGDEEFAKNMVIWTKVIKSGKKDVDGVLATVATVATLTEAQITAIKGIPAELVKAAEADIQQRIEKATDIDQLNVAGDLINSITDAAAVERLNAIYDARMSEISPA
jgi:hypothetical protein